MNENRSEVKGQRSEVTEEERHEAATEESATVGCPSLGLPKLPGGFDGAEPGRSARRSDPTVVGRSARRSDPTVVGRDVLGAPVSDESKKKLENSYHGMRDRLEKIANIALAADAKCGVSGRIGENWKTCSKAICEIRRICKQSFAEEIVPDYDWLARIMTSEHFDPECLAKAIEAEAAKRPIDYPTFYTPGWLCDLAKKIAGDRTAAALSGRRGNVGDGEAPAGGTVRKHTMDFGRFRVVRFAIPGMTLLSFRRKQEQLAESGSLVKGRIIVAEIRKRDVGGEKLVNCFTVKSHEPGEAARVLYAGDSWVSMSKTEKMVYKMVKCDIKETQRRHISRKRKAAAKAAAQKEVK